MADLVDPIRARRKILLTGTPIVNRPNELHPLIAYLDPTRWGNYMTYAKRYCDAHEEQVSRYKRVWIFSGANEANLPELQETLRGSIMIRRLKTDVLTELPRKMRQVIEVPATKEMEGLVKAEQMAYDGDEDAEIDSDEMKVRFEEMARIRHDLAVAKVPFIVEHVKDMMEETDKIVIMAHHHDVQDALMAALPAGSAVLHRGGLSEKQKQEAVDRFQNDPSIKVFVGSIKASGVGITLTASHNVIFAELDWVPGNISQAEDRCHRIGQTDTVWVQHLVVEGSLDATMANRIIEKQRIMDKALDDKRVLPDPEPKKEEKREATRPAPEKKQSAYTDDQIAAAHEALKIVAGMDPDRARQRNDVGFSASDGEFGHSLANAARWSEKQEAFGMKLAIKYQRQLPKSLVARLKGEAIEVEPEPEPEPEKEVTPTTKKIKVGWSDAERDELRQMCLKYGPFQGCKEMARVHPERSEAGCMYQWSQMQKRAQSSEKVISLKARLRG